jgi:hypothetical protein
MVKHGLKDIRNKGNKEKPFGCRFDKMHRFAHQK